MLYYEKTSISIVFDVKICFAETQKNEHSNSDNTHDFHDATTTPTNNIGSQSEKEVKKNIENIMNNKRSIYHLLPSKVFLRKMA